VRKVTLAALLLISFTTVFAEDVKAPEIKADDQLMIIRLQKQLSDLRVQYNQLFQQWLQSDQVVSITAQSIDVNNRINQAFSMAIKNANVDTNKWSVNRDTLQISPAPNEPKK
jgi:hypothetical protein